MQAEIISIGSELTNGQNLDTNARWLSQRLSEIGVPVGFHTTVADNVQANVDVFREATRRAEIAQDGVDQGDVPQGHGLARPSTGLLADAKAELVLLLRLGVPPEVVEDDPEDQVRRVVVLPGLLRHLDGNARVFVRLSVPPQEIGRAHV